MKRVLAGLIAAVGMVAAPMVADAHNAGHIFLPDGSCHQLASFRDAPAVGQNRTQLDLVPETPNPPFDEYGVSFVGFNGRTPIFPGPCPVARDANASSVAESASPSASSSSGGQTTATGPFFSMGPKKDR